MELENFQATSCVPPMLSCGTSALSFRSSLSELLTPHTAPSQIGMASAVLWGRGAASKGHTFGGRRDLLRASRRDPIPNHPQGVQRLWACKHPWHRLRRSGLHRKMEWHWGRGQWGCLDHPVVQRQCLQCRRDTGQSLRHPTAKSLHPASHLHHHCEPISF